MIMIRMQGRRIIMQFKRMVLTMWRWRIMT